MNVQYQLRNRTIYNNPKIYMLNHTIGEQICVSGIPFTKFYLLYFLFGWAATDNVEYFREYPNLKKYNHYNTIYNLEMKF